MNNGNNRKVAGSETRKTIIPSNLVNKGGVPKRSS